jgi:hypothetical protein
MDINIPTNKNKIFKQYLSILNPILSVRKLTKIEIDVLGTIMFIDNKYSHLTKDQRNTILFNKLTKDKIRQSLNNLSLASYNNVLTSLRKKQMISNRELLITIPIINNEVQINYKLKLE